MNRLGIGWEALQNPLQAPGGGLGVVHDLAWTSSDPDHRPSKKTLSHPAAKVKTGTIQKN